MVDAIKIKELKKILKGNLSNYSTQIFKGYFKSDFIKLIKSIRLDYENIIIQFDNKSEIDITYNDLLYGNLLELSKNYQDDTFLFKWIEKIDSVFGLKNVVFGGSFAMKIYGLTNRNKFKDLDFALMIPDNEEIFKLVDVIKDNKNEDGEDGEDYINTSSISGFVSTFKYDDYIYHVRRSELLDFKHDIFIWEDKTYLEDKIITMKYDKYTLKVFKPNFLIDIKRNYMESIIGDNEKHEFDLKYISKMCGVLKSNNNPKQEQENDDLPY